MIQRHMNSAFFMVALVLKLLGPLYVLLCFPNDLDRRSVALNPTSMQHRLSMSSSPPNRSGDDTFKSRVCKALNHTTKALYFLVSKRFAATFCYIEINFVDSAIQDIILLFL